MNAKKREISSGIPINTRSSYPNTVQFRVLCKYCDKPRYEDERHPNRSEHLHAAASKKKYRDYIAQFTPKIKQIAVELEGSQMINLLDQDIRSSELFYHPNFHADYIKEHEKYIRAKYYSDISEIDKYVALSALADYIKSRDNDTFDIHELQMIYIKHFADRGKMVQPHVTRFADMLKKSNIGDTVVQECNGGKYKLHRTTKLETIIITDNEWLKLC